MSSLEAAFYFVGAVLTCAIPMARNNAGVERYGMEVQRLCSVLDQHLAINTYLCGDEYTIADMAVLPWFQMLRTAKGYKHHTGVAARDFLSISQYKHAARWADVLIARPAVQRGLLVCSTHRCVMYKAAEHFPRSSQTCGVCFQYTQSTIIYLKTINLFLLYHTP